MNTVAHTANAAYRDAIALPYNCCAAAPDSMVHIGISLGTRDHTFASLLSARWQSDKGSLMQENVQGCIYTTIGKD